MKKLILLTTAICIAVSSCSYDTQESTNGIIFKREYHPSKIVSGRYGGSTQAEYWSVAYAECDTEGTCTRRPGVSKVTPLQFEQCRVGDWYPDCTRRQTDLPR